MSETTFPLVFGQCQSCGLSQLAKTVEPAALVPRYGWITYNEPEGHLDDCVRMLSTLPGIGPSALICGLTYKEDSTLRRFRELGFPNTCRLDFATDLDIHDSKAGIETFQSKMQPPLADTLRKRYGAPDVVIARHVLEHATQTANFMETLRRFVKPSGYVIFEVPDCGRAFDLLDYTTLWEDHSLYFVQETFLATLERGGFSVERFVMYSAPYENCLIAVTKPGPLQGVRPLSAGVLGVQKARATRFAEQFPARRDNVRALLRQWRNMGRIALFGAGHQSVMFVNLMGVASLIDLVLDDHPGKKGLQLPGSHLPIVGSNTLENEDFKLCLCSLSAESEQKVVGKNQAFLDKGGTFLSIFPTARNPVFNYIAGKQISSQDDRTITKL